MLVRSTAFADPNSDPDGNSGSDAASGSDADRDSDRRRTNTYCDGRRTYGDRDCDDDRNSDRDAHGKCCRTKPLYESESGPESVSGRQYRQLCGIG